MGMSSLQSLVINQYGNHVCDIKFNRLFFSTEISIESYKVTISQNL